MVKCTLGIWKWPRLQPCKLMKDEFWLSLLGREIGPTLRGGGSMALRGHEDKKHYLANTSTLLQGIFQFRK